ncbi:hypothetical protein SM139_3221, partial [Stenotrophomonas maltophilia]
ARHACTRRHRSRRSR